MTEKRTFTGRIVIADAQDVILDFDVINTGGGFKLVTKYHIDQQEIKGLTSEILFNKDWQAEKPDLQNIINWVRDVFSKKRWSLPY